jgi:hypothetical protein
MERRNEYKIKKKNKLLLLLLAVVACATKQLWPVFT